MPPPVKNFQRFSLWKCSFVANPKLRNYTFSDKPQFITDTVQLTLQFPLTETGWNRLQSYLAVAHADYGMHKLLCATPMQEELADATA